MSERGLVTQRIREAFSLRGNGGAHGAISAERRLEFARMLRTLLVAGLTVTDALAVIAEESNDTELVDVIKRTLDLVRNGKSLSQAGAQSPQA
ncbi:MAG: type II secretion system F family protein, partial [Gammaproteobacteria bacterium]|nr:type II secretion system F family protein [Gammaproteobacteria bacterium]